MLSKPWSDSSGGSSASTSISRSRRSRTALPYSNRFSRWSGGRPGFGRAAAAASSSASSPETKASRVSGAGRRRPGGGIAPLRSLRTTFSQVSAPAATAWTSARSSSRPAVRVRALWQTTQYSSRRARASGDGASAAGLTAALPARDASACGDASTGAAVPRPAAASHSRMHAPEPNRAGRTISPSCPPGSQASPPPTASRIHGLWASVGAARRDVKGLERRHSQSARRRPAAAIRPAAAATGRRERLRTGASWAMMGESRRLDRRQGGFR